MSKWHLWKNFTAKRRKDTLVAESCKMGSTLLRGSTFLWDQQFLTILAGKINTIRGSKDRFGFFEGLFGQV